MNPHCEKCGRFFSKDDEQPMDNEIPNLCDACLNKLADEIWPEEEKEHLEPDERIGG